MLNPKEELSLAQKITRNDMETGVCIGAFVIYSFSSQKNVQLAWSLKFLGGQQELKILAI